MDVEYGYPSFGHQRQMFYNIPHTSLINNINYFSKTINMLKAIKQKHKVLLNPGILKQEFMHIRYGRLYWLKYLTDKEFRATEQRKRRALDDWNDEVNREIWKI